MSGLVQVTVAGSVDEAEELQALLERAGIAASLDSIAFQLSSEWLQLSPAAGRRRRLVRR